MVAQVKPKKAEKYPLGHAKENKPAEVYAKNGTSVAYGESAITKKGNALEASKMSVGSQVFKGQMDEVKSSGVKQRGHGAATKGYTSRGPMA